MGTGEGDSVDGGGGGGCECVWGGREELFGDSTKMTGSLAACNVLK